MKKFQIYFQLPFGVQIRWGTKGIFIGVSRMKYDVLTEARRKELLEKELLKEEVNV